MSAAAKNIRRLLERRLAALLEITPEELPKMKIGTLAHTLFLLIGNSEEIGGFSTCMHGLLQVLGREIVWADPEERSAENREVIN